MLGWISKLIAAGGVWGVCALMAIENVILPLPSELIMPMAGYDASRGAMPLWGAILFGALGGTFGALPLYCGARLLGRDKGRKWIAAHGHWLLVNKRDIDRAGQRFDDRGPIAVIVSQLVPGVRGLIAVPAGFARMNVLLFLLTNFIGTIVWCAVLGYLGKLLGPAFPKIDALLGPTGWTLLALLAVGAIGWMIVRRTTRGQR